MFGKFENNFYKKDVTINTFEPFITLEQNIILQNQHKTALISIFIQNGCGVWAKRNNIYIIYLLFYNHIGNG